MNLLCRGDLVILSMDYKLFWQGCYFLTLLQGGKQNEYYKDVLLAQNYSAQSSRDLPGIYV